MHGINRSSAKSGHAFGPAQMLSGHGSNPASTVQINDGSCGVTGRCEHVHINTDFSVQRRNLQLCSSDFRKQLQTWMVLATPGFAYLVEPLIADGLCWHQMGIKICRRSDFEGLGNQRVHALIASSIRLSRSSRGPHSSSSCGGFFVGITLNRLSR